MKNKFLLLLLSFASVSYVDNNFAAAVAKEQKAGDVSVKEKIDAEIEVFKNDCLAGINTVLKIAQGSENAEEVLGCQEEIQLKLAIFKRKAINLGRKAREHGINFDNELGNFVKKVAFDAYEKTRKLMNDMDPQKLIMEGDTNELKKHLAGIECKIQ